MRVKDIVTGEMITPMSSNAIVTKLNVNNYSAVYSVYRNHFIKFLYHGRTRYALNTDVLKSANLKYNADLNLYYDENDGYSFTPAKFAKFEQFESFVDARKKFPLSIKDKIKFGIVSPSFIISEGKKYTFGVEIETSSGYVNPGLVKDLNVKSVRDGSLYSDNGKKAWGGEYVTGVLTGDTGFIQLKKILKVLSSRTFINKTCSVHVHLGNITFNKETMVLLWKMAKVLEDELFSMMPPSRSSSRHARRMNNIFGMPLSSTDSKYQGKISMYYAKIIKILSLGHSNDSSVNKKYNHPMGHYCGYNTSTPRYWWVNFIPAVFNLKGVGNYTIEYRLHSATLSYEKIRNWILICMAMVSVVEDHKHFIIDNDHFKIADILKLAYPKKWKYLSNYVNERKLLFSDTTNSELTELSEYKVSPMKEVISVKNVVWD